jgi:XTP/dITP diphosphohydrolase
MKKLLIATNNQGKIQEFKALLKGIPYELVTPGQIGLKLDVAETGDSYEANAEIKALAFAKAAKMLALADDSGLEVDALGGAPGIKSARYAGEKATDMTKVEYLLSKINNIPLKQRTARFRCVIAIAHEDGRIDFCRGACEGLITFEPRGKTGFGYDPIFLFPELGKTMAELPEDEKNRISHRGRAAQEAVKVLSTNFPSLAKRD